MNKKIYALLIVSALLFSCLASNNKGRTVEEYAQLLTAICSSRKQQLAEYFIQRQQHVADLAKSSELKSLFLRTRRVWRQQPLANEYEELATKCSDLLSSSMAKFNPYDIFLIDEEGVIIYTVKREKDFGKRLTNDQRELQLLAKCFTRLRQGPAISDLGYYSPSGEGAIFLGAPICDRAGSFLGGLVFQVSNTDVDSIMTDRKELGETGEAYLIRKDRKLVTESRFLHNAKLKMAVETEAAKRALKGEDGITVIKDYRGVPVLSKYSSISLGDQKWAILVEIDVSEMMRKMDEVSRRKIFDEVAKVTDEAIGPDFIAPWMVKKELCKENHLSLRNRKFIEVATGKWLHSGNKEVLATRGVATCTAIAVRSGEKGWLAHLSPTDVSYGHSSATRALLGSKASDLVGELFGEVEDERVKIVIVATHSDSFAPLTERFLAKGFSLDDIKFLCTRDVELVNVVFSASDDVLYTQWKDKEEREFFDFARVIRPVSEVIMKVLSQQVAKYSKVPLAHLQNRPSRSSRKEFLL